MLFNFTFFRIKNKFKVNYFVKIVLLCMFSLSVYAMEGNEESLHHKKTVAVKDLEDKQDVKDHEEVALRIKKKSRVAKKDHEAAARDSRPELSSSSSVSSGIPSSKSLTFYERFSEIMKHGPHPVTPLVQLTAEDEDREGSRKWVRRFGSNPEDHAWHMQMAKVIKTLRIANEQKKFLPGETNIAVARLTFVCNSGTPKIVEMPAFFLSGWPANDHRNPISKYSELLSQEKLGEDLKPYKHYALNFITQSYQRGTPETVRSRSYDPFKSDVKGIMEKALLKDPSIIGEARIKAHINILSGEDSQIQSKLYFHSEQAIWLYVKEEIKKFKRKLSSQVSPGSLHHVMVDICSIYDMCWCCGDTFSSCCHIAEVLDAQVFVRTSGCFPYFDKPFETKPPYALRAHREKFSGYVEGKAFTMPPDIFRPYIAHACMEDMQ